MWYTHTMKYFSGLKRKEILPHNMMSLESIMLSVISQSQNHICVIPCI